jgi:hypothetical protein
MERDEAARQIVESILLATAGLTRLALLAGSQALRPSA